MILIMALGSDDAQSVEYRPVSRTAWHAFLTSRPSLQGWLYGLGLTLRLGGAR
jgi:hypothetical protein